MDNKTGLRIDYDALEAEYSSVGQSIALEEPTRDGRARVELIELQDIMRIKEMKIELSPNINIFMGENSTGKTAILKSMYSLLVGYKESLKCSTKEQKKNCLEQKIKHIFQPKELRLGNIVNKDGNKAVMRVEFADGRSLNAEFGKNVSDHISVDNSYNNDIGDQHIVYIPPKEMASVYGLVPLYETYKITIEEMYIDLMKQLSIPDQKNPSEESKNIVAKLNELIGGDVHTKDGELFLQKDNEKDLEMGLVSEGYRKIVTIIQLIKNGNLNKGDILLWDEPEANMNPKMTERIVDALVELSKMGIQILITTHDYFISHELGLKAKYDENKLQYKFFALYTDEDDVLVEVNDDLFEMDHNAIMEQFDELYDRGTRLKWN